MFRFAVTAILLLPFSAAGLTATVYKTVSEDGVVSFSDSPPAGGAQAEVLEISAPAAQSPQEYVERLEQMREATDRLASDRREREKHRAQLREIQARTDAHQEPVQPAYPQYADFYPSYSQRYHRRTGPPWRHGYRPRPQHRVARPPMRRGHGGFGSSNAQLMRPLVSPRR